MSKLTPEELQRSFDILNEKKTDDNKFTLEDIEALGSRQTLLTAVEEVHRYSKMLQQRITLINAPLTATIPFTCGNLYLFTAYSGSGKSTVAANITYPLWKEGKRTLVISNEETREDVLFRIGCLELGLNFNDYKKGTMSNEDRNKVIALWPSISEYVHVLDVSDRNGITTKVEGVKSALDAIKHSKKYSCVLIDYFQLIKYSTQNPKNKAYENLNDLRIWLGQYIKSADMPVVLFAQLYASDKRGGAKSVEARLKECSSIIEPATVIIEICPNFDNQTSEFIIHKDRFGRSGHKIVCGFEKGKFIKITMDELVEREKRAKLKDQNEKIAKLEAIVRADE